MNAADQDDNDGDSDGAGGNDDEPADGSMEEPQTEDDYLKVIGAEPLELPAPGRARHASAWCRRAAAKGLLRYVPRNSACNPDRT